MIRPTKLNSGDKVAIVSLSDGVLGEKFISHEIALLEKRLKSDLGLNFEYMANARKGQQYLSNHPEARAQDLKQAFLDPSVKIIWSAIGGDDSFRTLPYLMDDEFRAIVRGNPKIFIGMSDATNSHLMLYQMGLASYYGPAVLSDIAELGPEIFPYTLRWLKELFRNNQPIVVSFSSEWYESRETFGPDQLGVSRVARAEMYGHEYLFGSGVVEGQLLGGCLDSLYEILTSPRYSDQLEVYSKFPIFPNRNSWRDKVIFLETSEECPPPPKFKEMLKALDGEDIFTEARALIVGKPQNERYYNEYKQTIFELATNRNLPTVFNLNFGHTTPRMILPYGAPFEINFEAKEMRLVRGMNLEG